VLAQQKVRNHGEKNQDGGQVVTGHWGSKDGKPQVGVTVASGIRVALRDGACAPFFQSLRIRKHIFHPVRGILWPAFAYTHGQERYFDGTLFDHLIGVVS